MPVLDFLKNIPNDIENLAVGAARLPVQFAENYANTFANIGNRLAGGQDQTIQQNMGGNDALNQALNFSQATGTGRQLASDVAQAGLYTLPGAGTAKTVLGTAAKSAAIGAGVGGAANVAAAAGQGGDQNYKLDFLQGAGAGALLGGTIGGGAKFISDAKAAKLAKLDDPKAITKELTPDVGPVIAEKAAPAIALTNDPNIVQNAVGNEIHKVTPEPTSPPRTETPPAQPAPTTQPPTKPFLNAPNEANPKPTSLSALDARQSAANILNQGGTVDEAMNEFFNNGMNLGEATQAMRELMQPGGAGILDRSKVNASLNPEYGKVKFPTATIGDGERAPLNAQTANNEVWRRANAAIKEGDKLSPNDIKLLDYLRNGDPQELSKQADNPEQFLKTANLIKNYNDYTQAAGAYLGQDIPYKRQYGVRPQYDLSTDKAKANFQNAQAKLAHTTGYTKGAFFKNYDEAAQFGIQRQNENALQDLAQDASMRANDQSQLALYKALDEAYPGQVSVGNLPPGNKQILIPGGEKLSMPSAIADEINKRAPAPNANGFWKGYDTLNSNLKNVKLAGGGFHSINVMGSYLGQQLVSGKLFTPTGAKDLGVILQGTFSDKAFKSIEQQLNDSGHLLAFDQLGLVHKMGGIQADIGQATGIISKVPLLNQIHEAIFGRQIPLLKMLSMKQQMDKLGIDPRNMSAEDIKTGTAIAKELNQNYGGFNRAIQGLTPQQFQKAARLFLATDYNEGQIRSVIDAFSKGGAEGKLARQVVFGKALLFGGLATTGAAAGGNFQGKTPEQVAFDILHKVVNPSFNIGGYKVGFPTTQIAEIEKPIEETVKGVQSGHNLQGIQNFANARLAAIPAASEQLLGNQNYAGQHIYGTDTHGRPISPGTTAANVAGIAAPIPFNQTVQTATGNQSLGAAAANVAGLRVTPQYDASRLQGALQDYLKREQASGYPQDKISADTEFFSILQQNSKARTNAATQMKKDSAKGDITAVQQDASKYNTKLLQALRPWVQQNQQYMDGTLYQELTGSFNAMGSNLGLLRPNISRSAQKTIQKNPTKYGLPITPLGGTQ